MIESREKISRKIQKDDTRRVSFPMEESQIRKKRISWPGCILILAVLLLVWLLHITPVVILSLTQSKVSIDHKIIKSYNMKL